MILALLDVLRAYPGQIPDVDAVLSVADFPCVPLCADMASQFGWCFHKPVTRLLHGQPLIRSRDTVNIRSRIDGFCHV